MIAKFIIGTNCRECFKTAISHISKSEHVEMYLCVSTLIFAVKSCGVFNQLNSLILMHFCHCLL